MPISVASFSLDSARAAAKTGQHEPSSLIRWQLQVELTMMLGDHQPYCPMLQETRRDAASLH